MAAHSSILAWRIPWTEEPGGPQSMVLQRVRHDLATKTTSSCFIRSLILLRRFLNHLIQHYYLFSAVTCIDLSEFPSCHYWKWKPFEFFFLIEEKFVNSAWLLVRPHPNPHT